MKIINRLRITPLFIFLALLLSGCTLPFAAQSNSGLRVESTPAATVYIDNQHVGETPFFGEKIKPGEHLVKIVPQVDETQAYETKINLKPNTVIFINRTFAPTPQESTNYILDLEKINSKDTSEITVITTPANAIVRLDDQPKGFAPLLNVGVNPSQHKITLNAQGYKSLEIQTEIKVGYRLVVTAELGKLYPLKADDSIAMSTESAQIAESTPSPSVTPIPSPTSSPSPSLTPTPEPTIKSTLVPPKPYVEILDTPTGWLRIRSEPNGLVDNEVAKVNSGTTHPFIETNNTGWYQIEYEVGKQGWIAAQYAKLIE